LTAGTCLGEITHTVINTIRRQLFTWSLQQK